MVSEACVNKCPGDANGATDRRSLIFHVLWLGTIFVAKSKKIKIDCPFVLLNKL
jgi:hypothetical protein